MADTNNNNGNRGVERNNDDGGHMGWYLLGPNLNNDRIYRLVYADMIDGDMTTFFCQVLEFNDGNKSRNHISKSKALAKAWAKGKEYHGNGDWTGQEYLDFQRQWLDRAYRFINDFHRGWVPRNIRQYINTAETNLNRGQTVFGRERNHFENARDTKAYLSR